MKGIYRSIACITTLAIGIAAGSLLSVDLLSEPAVPLKRDVVVADPKTDRFSPEFHHLPALADNFLTRTNGRVFQLFQDENDSDYIPEITDGQSWYVLAKDKNRYSLSKVRASVSIFPGPGYYDEELMELVTFPVKGEQILAVRGIPELKAGPVVTLFHDDGEDESFDQIGDKYRREFVLNGQSYVLRTSLGLTVEREKTAVLVLEKNGRSQVVKQLPYDDGGRNIIGNLLWAGDLDGDGDLDILFQEFVENCSIFLELHLSSAAENEELVGLAAR